ncbi:MAG: hypothetical protein DSY58_04430 [Desulfobulbus sp.]|nr:MAG: hypothetical protein DSY58_04430 [Desulfobulbus sp.]
MKFPSALNTDFPTRYTLLGGFFLMIFIIILPLFYYTNNAALQASSLNRFQLEVANKAATLDYFLLERKYDIRALADSQEIKTYFKNRAMGMSEEYGLKVSIFSISQSLQKTYREKTIDNKAIYSRIDFLDGDGTQLLLVTSAVSTESQSSKSLLLKQKKGDLSREPQVVIEDTNNHHEISLIAPCILNKEICGWIVARINTATLYNHFLSHSTLSSSTVFTLTLADGTPLKLFAKSTPDSQWLRNKKTISTLNTPVRVSVDLPGKSSLKVLFMRVQLLPNLLYLSGYVQQNKILGNINSIEFLTGAAAMVFILLFGLFWSIQTRMKHLLLKTRLDESTIQKRELTKKNLQLKEEITKRENAEKSLIENEKRYRKLFESSSDAIVIMKGARIIACNQQTVELFKLHRDKILIQSLYDFCPEKQPDGTSSKRTILKKIQQTLKHPQLFEWTLQTENTWLIDAEITMTPIILKSDTLIQVLIRDITEKKQTQEILIQTEKMMAVGGLAAGMAHEINNPLGIILQACQNTTRRLSPDLKKNHEAAASLNLDLELLQKYLQKRKILTYLESIHSAGERAAQIVKSMLDFGRSSKTTNTEFCDINALLDETLKIAESDYNLKKKYDFKKITISRQYGAIEKIICAKTEISQVFLNIIKNAAQAMGTGTFSGKTPEITIYTAPEPDGIIITISDNGPGISQKIQKSIFEPFFTTKPAGEGTGLGLSVSYFIITAHHSGRIEVDSTPGQGTTFTIRLPINKVRKSN